MVKHECYCGIVYECPYCHTPDSFICPTLNGDEDSNMCDACMEKFAASYQAFVDEQDG